MKKLIQKENKNKKAFIIVLEATIALMILFGFLFTSLEKQKQITSTSYNREDQNAMLLDYISEYLETDETFRNDIKNNNIWELNSSIQAYLLTLNKDINSQVRICEPDDGCDSKDIPRLSEVSTTEFLANFGNNEKIITKKVKIYLWEK